jgi:hypothetical protein
MPKKKKQELPVFVLIEMKPWQDRVLNFVLRAVGIKGTAWVVGVEDTGFVVDDEHYTEVSTGLKIKKSLLEEKSE